jgi:hypothetical protein
MQASAFWHTSVLYQIEECRAVSPLSGAGQDLASVLFSIVTRLTEYQKDRILRVLYCHVLLHVPVNILVHGPCPCQFQRPCPCSLIVYEREHEHEHER